ncbi:MAG: methylenetetrahydrofolate reductase [NAD(P)H] [Candidatus Omnitrophica bacterium]|nr:methylenetetrahydrofolate reductase [NAD(P)H] [Candidatus Omnitrophota bacterium]
MKITEIFKNRPKGIAFEFFPPKTQNGKIALAQTVRELKKYNPLYMSMTYGALGSTQERTQEATYMLLEEKDITVMPHLTCIGTKSEAIQQLLEQYRERGVENIMALRGDRPQGVADFDFLKQDFPYARDLVLFIKKYKHFCIGVAVYPEGHLEDISFQAHMEHTKRKIDAGADFSVTQMFFDNAHFYSFVDTMKKEGINIPVLPGILPLTDIGRAKQFCSTCKVSIPAAIENRLSRYADNSSDMAKAGLEITIRQCRELIERGHKQLHFFTLNKPEVIKTILEAIGL